LLKLRPNDFATLCSMEHQYTPAEVEVDVYPEDAGTGTGAIRKIKARAFITQNGDFLTVENNLAPTERYIKLIREGARWSRLDRQYVDWLFSIQGNDGQRGPEYYKCCGKERTRSTANGFGSPKRKTDYEQTRAIQVNANYEQANRHSPTNTRGTTWNTCSKTETKTEDAFSLRSPTGVFATETYVYAADSGNDRVLRFPRDEIPAGFRGSIHHCLSLKSNGETVAGGYGKGNNTWQLNRPFRLHILPGTSGQDILYIVDRNNNRIVRWIVGEDEGTIVAGGNGVGNGSHQLNQPSGVFVHGEQIYVADRANHRIMCWNLGGSTGTVVAGGKGFGSRPDQLMCPASVCVVTCKVGNLRTNFLLVTDEGNNRLQMFALAGGDSSRDGAPNGVTLAGRITPGGGTVELYHPLGLSCVLKPHSKLLVYIGDSLNYRVQEFEIDLEEALEAQTGTVQVSGTTPAIARTVMFHQDKSAKLGQPISVSVIQTGKGEQSLYVADSENNEIACALISGSRQVNIADKECSLTEEDIKIREGIVVEYRQNSGYGFVKEMPQGKLKYFAHHSDIMVEYPVSESATIHSKTTSGYPFLQKNDKVQFCSRADPKWGQRAACIVRRTERN